MENLRKEQSEKVARRSYSRLASVEKLLREDLNKFDEGENYEELNWQNIKIGDKALLKDLNQPVVILSPPDKNDNVFVQM